MFRIEDVFTEGKKIVGSCSDELFLRWCGDAFALIANKLDPEALKGFLDVCTVGCSCSNGSRCNSGSSCGKRCVTLPREVQTVLAVNIAGQPAPGFGQTFGFHINGRGDCGGSCQWSWMDGGAWHSVYRDLITPAKLVVFTNTPEDNNKQFIVLGYDSNGNVLRRQENGEWKNGLALPMVYGVAVPEESAPEVARITGIFKEKTVSQVRLATIDSSGATGVNLGVYEPSETVPQFRRITISRPCNWVRISYRKANPKFESRDDHVPLSSRKGFLLAISAAKYYSDLDLASAHAFEADAARLEIEAQQMLEPTTTYSPPEILDWNGSLRDKQEYDIR